MSISRALLTVVLCLTTAIAQAGFVQGLIGPDKKKLTHVEPQAVVMQDANGQETLLVFYRLREQKKQHLVGFSVARSVDKNGALVWDSKDYILKPEVFSTQGFAPQPVMADGALYLFGGQNHDYRYHKVLYNSFDSLDDLINHTQGKSGNSPAQYLDIEVSHYDTYLSVIGGETSKQESKILLTYHVDTPKLDPTFNYSSCTPQADMSLKCQHNHYWKNIDIYRGQFNHANVDVDGVQRTVMFTSRLGSEHLHFYTYDFNNNAYTFGYGMSGRDGNSDLHLSNAPAATAQRGDTLMLYYKNPYGNYIIRTSLNIHDIDKTSGAQWSIPTFVATPSKKYILPHRGLDAVQFKSRAYVFYSDAKTRHASYFSE